MSKPIIDQTTPGGALVATLPARAYALFADGERLSEAKPLALAGGGTMEGPFFGGSAGSAADYEYALDSFLQNLAAFKTANADFLAQLDQGNPL